MQAPILIVEDDLKIADMLDNYLRMQGYATLCCADGLQAVELVRSQAPAVVLLDVMLPSLDGVGVCAAVRAFSAVPIIMVTARVDEVDRLLGLETGADDYVCKPFSPREVVARIKALLRRTQGELLAPLPGAQPAANLGLRVDAAKRQVVWAGHALPLTQVEYRLLALLLSRPAQVFGRARLLDSLHEDQRDVSDRAIDSHIKNIRRKMEQAQVTEASIASVYGVGYRLDLGV
ncbi:response regulator [Rhodoferax aquaticus]|uniref:Response regulator n=1 Tax=Rhodoferax aquaticus TaxID=2527691 RepID=A0A515EJZ6_9BURK|nr:response regulator [Rhodoferax aquaticus]QDL52988.1 response regulator [Rhodoferax aquaticus]